jgi:hypothetical protein
LFTALEEFNVESVVGVELNPNMVEAIKAKAEDRGLKDKINIVNKSFFDVDLSPATIITLYLTTSGNAKLKPKFKEELKKGVRIVSHDFPINDWTTIDNDNGQYSVGSHKIYIYRIPESFKFPKKLESTHTENNRVNRIKNLFERLNRG